MTQMTNHQRILRRCLLATLPAAALLHVASCFQIVSPSIVSSRNNNLSPVTPPTTSSSGNGNTSDSSRNRFNYNRRIPVWSSSDPIDDPNSKNSNNGDQEGNGNGSADGLYEFLTRRTGEQAGEVERRRKRDRIREWMSSSSGNKRSTNMVQPIRMEDGSIMEEDDAPLQTKPKFENLFSGMPTLDEILTRGGDEENKTTPPTTSETGGGNSSSSSAEEPEKKRNKADLDNDEWFEEERQQLIREYEQILEDMKAQLAEQRKKDPKSVPPNSDRIIESVVFQERNRMIDSVKIARAKERLKEYGMNRMADVESLQNVDDVNDEIANRILQEAAEDYERRQALQSKFDEFARYEKEAFLASANDQSSEFNPQPGADLDKWALERLEQMLDSSKEESEDVADILEQNIDELRERIEKESKKGSIKPETMKEWQMYRAIATRLNTENPNGPDNEDNVDEERISNQLNSWREYIQKEEEIRNRSGLSVGPKMPFDWQKPGRDPREDPVPAATVSTEGKSRREIRRDVNIQAIKAMEELVQKSDNKRSEGLKKQLEALKAELESRDYNDIEEEVLLEEVQPGPVDLSDVFSREAEEDEEYTKPGFTDEEMYSIDRMLSNDPSTVSYAPSESQSSISNSFESETYQEKPNTPFFSDEEEEVIKPPASPFFSEETEKVAREDDIVNSKLGSGEEQKLRAMYRRAGAVTKEEQDAIREQWEAFQAFEKARRDESGLSGGDDSALVGKAKLKYDMSEVMKSDGDFDAEKILSTIGPRPKRNKKSAGSDGVGTRAVSGTDSPQSDNPQLGIDPAEVTDSLYRSVEAVGGGTTKDDPVARKQERSAFEEYLLKEKEMREKMDNPQEGVQTDSPDSIPLDDPDYVEDVLDSIGPRPMFKRTVKQVPTESKKTEKGVSGGRKPSVDDDDVDLVPNWLKKEREAAKAKQDDNIGLLGGNMDEVFDDDKYEHNLRQLHEYEQRRSGKSKQMGIDISDVLGRRGSDDYADYTYDTDYFRGRQDGWGAASFEARKRSLLEYTELTTVELNNLMDHRDSVYTTGASQYLPRINKPFKEFGAIFRLEGVLIDLTGLHYEVWKQVAAEYGFTEPMLEDVKRAAVARPEIAIREIFLWTNDFQLSNKALSSFRKIFRQKFDQWALDNGLKLETKPVEEEKNGMALGAELFSEVQAEERQVGTTSMTEEARLAQLKERWFSVAEKRGYPAPTNEQIAQCSFLPPDIAVRTVFRWTTDPVEIDSIIKALNGLDSPSSSQETTGQPDGSQMAGGSSAPLDEGAILELQYKAWNRVASDNNLEVPKPEEVLAASVLNDPEAVVMFGYGWTNDAERARELGKQFRDFFASLLKEANVAGPSVAKMDDANTNNNSSGSEKRDEGATSGPTEEEILKMQLEAWEKTAKAHDFSPPSPDQIQLTLNLSATDSVRRLLGWTYNFNGEQIKEISATYEKALKEASEKYLSLYNIPVETVSLPKAAKEEKSAITADMLYQAAFDAWTNLAWKSGKPMPNQQQVQFAMTVGPDEAVVKAFKWTEDYSEAAEFAAQYRAQLKGRREEWKKKGYLKSKEEPDKKEVKEEIPLVMVKEGVGNWIKSLQEVEMGCGVASHLERDQMDILINYAGLGDLFPPDKRVSLNNGYDRESQQMLGVALRIERRPDHCVSFDSSPYANSAAQEVDMRSVAMVGPYPRYDLLSADTSAFSFDELTALNIRRLFGERVYDQPMLDMKQNQPEQTRKTKTKFWDPDD